MSADATETKTPPTAVDLDRPFTPAQFRGSGRNPRRLHARDHYVQLMRGVWIRAKSRNRLSVIHAALLIHPESAYASHVSAAEVLGLPVPETPFAHVTVTEHKDRRFRPEIKPHVTDRRQHVIEVDGTRCTGPIATFIDCAGMLGLVDMVVLGDAIVATFDITPADLVKACQRSSDYYAKRALLAALFVREGVDSPMETRLRMLIVLAGLPEPVVNYRVWNDDGTWRRRFDLCYPGLKLIIEYDGLHHTEPGQWERDLQRREEFDEEGFRVLVVTARGIYREPLKTLCRIRRQLIARGMPDVPELDPRWQDHFGA